MNLLIDGESHSLPLDPTTTFSDVMLAISRQSPTPGVGITKVKLNDEDITGADWTRFASLTVAEIHALEVQTGNTVQLAKELLDSLDDFTERLITELNRTVEALRAGDQQRASELYSRTLDGIQLLHHTTGMIERNLQVDTSKIIYGGRPSSEQLQKLPPVIDDLLAAQTKGDWVLLADLIEYELIPQFEDHQNVLKLWREAVVVSN
jgi:hypothetical protein